MDRLTLGGLVQSTFPFNSCLFLSFFLLNILSPRTRDSQTLITSISHSTTTNPCCHQCTQSLLPTANLICGSSPPPSFLLLLHPPHLPQQHGTTICSSIPCISILQHTGSMPLQPWTRMGPVPEIIYLALQWLNTIMRLN